MLLSIAIYYCKPEWMNILHGNDFFKSFSPLHILWMLWIVDMTFQLIPVKGLIPLGSQKLFGQHFRSAKTEVNYNELRAYIISSTKAAYRVFIIWGLLTLVLGLLYHMRIVSAEQLFLISVFFYVCDLICVLIWCPFRLIMGNRCCTTCRIFNWDHLMMFTPMLFVNSLYSVSLLIMAFAVWLVWELSVMLYPERFYEQSNLSLRCSECTDKLCTQYCRKSTKK